MTTMTTNELKISRLHNIVVKPDAELLSFLYDTYNKPDSEYKVHTDGVNYVFCIPTTPQLIPVLLQAHVDTRRTKVDEPVVLCTEHDCLTNANGVLGGDDRCGVAGIMEIANSHTAKPFLLFTNYEESGGWGMKKFLETKLMEPYLDLIYCVIALDRRGHNEYVYYSSSLPGDLEYKLDTLGYYGAVGSYSDCKDIWMQHNIAHVNVSCGYAKQHTANESVLLESYISSVNRADQLMQMIDKPMRVPYVKPYSKYEPYYYEPITHPDVLPSEVDLSKDDGAGAIPECEWYYTTVPRCSVCGRADREVYFDESAGMHLCKTCAGQIVKHLGSITAEHAQDYYVILEDMRSKTREANRNLNKSKPAVDYPACPVCGDNIHVTWSKQDICFVCTACNEYQRGGYGGKFWIRGNTKVHVKNNTVITTNSSGTKLLSSEPLTTKSSVKLCAVCHQPTMSGSVEVIGHTRKNTVIVCPACKQVAVDTVLNSNLPPW